MADYQRQNAWNDQGTFANEALYWYAKGVGKMMSRPITDRTSWWFYAAIHGEYVDPSKPWYPKDGKFPAWKSILPPPVVSTTPLPDQADIALYWDNCQHGSWYFLPWHRGYLLSIEAQLREDIQSLQGPDNWALPYWDYLNPDCQQSKLPPAFAVPTMQDEQLNQTVQNPLYVFMRYGPTGDQQDIYAPTKLCYNGPINGDAMSNTIYTGSNSQTKPPGFGGPRTGFAHNGSVHGNLESNPHDLVHGYVGGQPPGKTPYYGLMADPNTAALDPIFYLHHCNIDRMWAAWNLKNANPVDSSWLSGPVSKPFVMPVTPKGALTAWYYTPGQMDTIGSLGYSYQELTAPLAELQLNQLATRFATLGASPAQADAEAEKNVSKPLIAQELLGASSTNLQVRGNGLRAAVNLRPAGAADVAARASAIRESFVQSTAPKDLATREELPTPTDGERSAPETPTPDQFFLTLENITGTFDATIFDVYVEPAAAAPAAATKAAPAATDAVSAPAAADDSSVLAGSVALFGLRLASVPDGPHGGEGLTFTLDVTSAIYALNLENNPTASALSVSLVPKQTLQDEATVQVGRISISSQSF